MPKPHAALRVSLALALSTTLGACTQRGINAGEQGGRAFMALTVMLVLIVAIMVIAMGREK